MTAPFPWSDELHTSKGLVEHGARRTTAHVLKEGLKRTFDRVLGEVRRCSEVRRDDPVAGERTVSFLRPAGDRFDNCPLRPVKGEDQFLSDLRRHAPTAADHPYGSFPGDAGVRGRRRPTSRQQDNLKSRLTQLTGRTRRLTRRRAPTLHISKRGR
jgi:hypothetical protein